MFLLVYFKSKRGRGLFENEKKNQDVDDDDLHFMQKALLKRRWEASTPTLHRHIVIIIITTIIISVTMMTTCFPSRASAENSKALSHVENFTSFHYSMNAKTFALSTRCASSSFPCRSVHTERRIGFFFVSSSSAATSRLVCFLCVRSGSCEFCCRHCR